MPESLREVGGYVFGGCEALKTLEFKSNIEKIWEVILYDCENVEAVYYTGTREQWENIQISTHEEDGQNNDILERLLVLRPN